jgi:hypothetical protein
MNSLSKWTLTGLVVCGAAAGKAGCGLAGSPAAPSSVRGRWEGARLIADAGAPALVNCGEVRPPCRTWSDSRYVPTVVLNGRGQGLVVWHQDDGALRQWWSPYTQDAGFGAPSPTGHPPGSNGLRLAMGDDGRAVAAWQWSASELDLVGPTLPETPALSRFSPFAGWEAPEQPGAAGDHLNDMDLHRSGHAIVLYDQGCGRTGGSCGPGRGLQAARFMPDSGALVREQVREGERYPCAQIGTGGRVAATRDGALAVWTELGLGALGCSAFREVWSSRLVPGRGWTAAEPLDRVEWLGGIQALDVVVDEQGDGFVVYERSPNFLDNEVWVRPFKAAGWSEPQQIADSSSSPRILMDRQGNAFLSWMRQERLPGGLRTFTLQVRWFTKRDQRWSSTYALPADVQVFSSLAAAALDDNGHAVLAYGLPIRDSAMYEVWANRFTAGHGFGPLERIQAPESPGAIAAPSVGSDARGNAVVVWAETDGLRIRIWSNRYLVDG